MFLKNIKLTTEEKDAEKHQNIRTPRKNTVEMLWSL